MKKVQEDKTKVGRPRLNIDGEKISKWISYGATVKEIADVENCSEDHIHKVFRDKITKGKAERNMRLRKAQFELAWKGNCSMLIWLGKQYLDQKDTPDPDKENLPQGFDIKCIMNDYEQETVQEYEENRDEFLQWKVEQDNNIITH